MAPKKGASQTRKASSGEETCRLRPGVSFPVVAVGASAGGLAAFTALLKSLPSTSGMAFVLIQHLEPEHESALTSLLSKVTSMPVVEVSDGIVVQQNHVYVIPPNKDMTIREATLRLTPRTATSRVQRPIDEFCIALANEQGNTAIGVILSGTGSDGTQGLRAIKAAGGVSFAQDPKTAEWSAMPLNAITAGAVDFVLSPKRIAAELERIGRHPYLSDANEVPEGSELDKVCMILRSAVGIDFRLYKQATVRRRIARRMALQRIESLAKYSQILKQDREEVQALADEIFIHVTSFFRDPECFQALGKKVLANLGLKRSAEDPIRIWVAGCSTGEEVYSIAILLMEELGERANRIKIQIFGTDIQERAVQQARAGIYSDAAVVGVSPARLKKFFVKADHGYQVQKNIRDLCVFARHDLAKDPPFSRLDLISCRNVLIYMGPALQKRLLSIFQYALKPGGFLFLGNSESISGSDAFVVEDQKHRVFVRKATSTPLHDFRPSDFHHEPNAAPARTSAPSVAPDFRKEAEAALLERYAPPAIIVDPDLHIVHFQGDVSPYLGPPTGQPSLHLLKMVRPEFLVELRIAISKAWKEGVAVHRDAVQFKHEGNTAAVNLEVSPLKRTTRKKPDLMIVFQRVSSPVATVAKEEQKGRIAGKQSANKINKLERELASAQEYLRALIAEHETAQEEMKAANEEILSSNEELQSTNEELETAKEELQSSNEELVTLNDELQHHNEALNVLTQDLSNLLVGVDIPVLVLDADLRIRRFTPVAGATLNLIPSDVGRPFSDVASTLNVVDWKELFSDVGSHGRLVEREVTDQKGHRYSMRVRPYKTSNGLIEGVLLVLLDIDLIYRARDAARKSGLAALQAKQDSESILNSLDDQVAVLAADGTILATNDAWNRFATDNRERSLSVIGPGANYLELCRKAEGVPEAKPALDGIQGVIQGTRPSFQLEYTYHSSTGQRWFLMSVAPLKGTKGGAVVTHADITARKQAQEHELSILREFVERAPMGVLMLDRRMRGVQVSQRWLADTGLTRDQIIGRSLYDSLPNLPAHWQDLHRRSLAGESLSAQEEVYTTPDGVEHCVNLEITPWGDTGETTGGILIAAEDITEKKRAELEVRDNAATIRSLMESTPHSVIAVQMDETIVLVNGNTESMFGYKREELLGQKLDMLIPENLRGRHSEHHKDYFATMQTRAMGIGLTLEARRKDGSRFPVEVGLSGIETAAGKLAVAFVNDISERRRLEESAERYAQQVQSLAANLLTAQEEERRRVSRELHDQICQQLASLSIDIGGLAAKPLPEDARRQLKDLQARVVKASEETRHIAYELHSAIIDDLGLAVALQELGRQFSERNPDIVLDFKSGKLPSSIPREVASCLYRVTEESLNNITKHAQAKHASVAVGVERKALTLTITDDGIGFDLKPAKGQGGIGLIGMGERVRLINGKLSISPKPGQGTRIKVEVPLPEGSS